MKWLNGLLLQNILIKIKYKEDDFKIKLYIQK